MEYSPITVAETQPFQRKAAQLLSEFERSELIIHLSVNPSAGVLIKGAVGIRVVYYFHSQGMPLYLLTLFGKNEKANLSLEEKNTLSKLVRELVKYWSEMQ